jgi:predicted nucleic acid-binding protein
MSVPGAIFIDTSILAGQQYNFASTAFAAFTEVVRKRGLQLLLPDPTKREVLRQIAERSTEALKALEVARRRAPFLSKWRHFPVEQKPWPGDWEVRRVANAEWQAFLQQFEVVALSYDGINVATVMDWYDAIRAPFGEGKKRKEFPDAFAIATLAEYASKTGSCIAVLSADEDFRRACAYYPGLLYFPSLPSLTELLLADEERIEPLKALVEASGDKLKDAVSEAIAGLSFYHAYEEYNEIEDVEDVETEIVELKVISLGATECTVAFEADFSYSVRLSIRYSGNDDGDEVAGWVYDTASTSGTAKLQLEADLSAVKSVVMVDLEDRPIEVRRELRD